MIEIKDLEITFTGFKLKNVNLFLNKGEFFALLGPTGSGKTVLLDSIAGLKHVNSGKIFINGRDVTPFKPEERNISIVYQDYALFPNMNVRENIKYGLRFKKNGDSSKYKHNFALLVDMLGIRNILDRKIHNLSGGERQRVALARALIVEPDILLLDEPFSALDTNTKEIVQSEIKKIHNELKITTIMVTHNFSEVFSLADKVAVIRDGVIQQIGTAEEVFRIPNSIFVAKFVGMKNIFSFEEMNDKITVDDFNGSANYSVGLRAEDIVVGTKNLQTDYQLNGFISDVSNNGIYTEVKVKTGNLIFTAYLTPNRYFELGLSEKKPVFLGFNKNDIILIMKKDKHCAK